MLKTALSTAGLQAANLYCAAVVGAGPAGVAAVGQLLDSELVARLAWFDPRFKGGRLEAYREVPSNTKTGLFVTFGEACKAFGGPGNSAVAQLQQLPQDRGCQLGYAHDLVSTLTARLRRQPSVTDLCGTVSQLEKDGQHWRLVMTEDMADGNRCLPSAAPVDGVQVQPPIAIAKRVFLATGSHPRTGADIGAPHLQSAARTGAPAAAELPLDTALCPSALQQAVTADDEVAVVGSSHSAVLALKNLAELPSKSRPKRIVNFYRSPLLYAEYRNDEHGQWIMHDNTGLKGLAAEWAKQHLEPCKAATVPALERVCIGGVPGSSFDKSLPGCTKIVYAVGYKQNPLPRVVVDGEVLQWNSIGYNPQTGQLLNKTDGRPLQHLYGFGIAFPEAWTDPIGNKEMAVGMFKFMRYLKEAVPASLSNQDEVAEG